MIAYIGPDGSGDGNFNSGHTFSTVHFAGAK